MGIIISLPISLLLLWLVLKPKKNDPFPKGGLARMVIAGLLCTFVAGILSQVFSLILVAIRIGPANLTEVINKLRSDMAGATELMQSLSPKGRSPLWTLFTTLITAGLLEELCKYFACRVAIRKEGMLRTWMDSVICFTVVGLVFQILENFLYGGQYGVITAIFRNLAPGHFIFGVMMGWYFGKYLITGEKKYRFQSILWPAVIHTLYDTALKLMPAGESVEENSSDTIFIILGLLAFVAAFVMTIVVIVKLVRWRKKGTLDVPVSTVPTAPAP